MSRSRNKFFARASVLVNVTLPGMIAPILAWEDVQGHEFAKQDAFQCLDLFHEYHDLFHSTVKRDNFRAIFYGYVDVHGRMQLDASIVFQFRELIEQPVLVMVERDDEKAILEAFRALGGLVFQEFAQRVSNNLGSLGTVLLAISLEFGEKILRDRDRDPIHVFFRIHREHLIDQFPCSYSRIDFSRDYM